MDYEVIGSKTVYRGVIVDVKKDMIRLPDGKTALREVVAHPGGAAVLPVDGEGFVYLVRQYRHPARALALEIPAGIVEAGEDHAECAGRELAEEAGFKAARIAKVSAVYSCIGFCDERTHIFIATGLEACERDLDPEEFIDVERYYIDEALEMVRRGEITDGKTVIALLAYKAGLY